MIFDEVHISSLVVHVKPQFLDTVQQQIELLAGTEIFASSEAGKIVVVLECDKQHQITSTLEQINQLEHVLNAFLVFHQIDAKSTISANAIEG